TGPPSPSAAIGGEPPGWYNVSYRFRLAPNPGVIMFRPAVRWFLIAFLLVAPGPVLADPPSPDKLAERDRLKSEADKLAAGRKFADAAAAYRKVLAIEQEAYGKAHAVPTETLAKVANLTTLAGDLQGAIKLWEEVRDLRTKLHGADHFLVIDTTWLIDDLTAWGRFSLADKASAGKAGGLHQRAAQRVEE